MNDNSIRAIIDNLKVDKITHEEALEQFKTIFNELKKENNHLSSTHIDTFFNGNIEPDEFINFMRKFFTSITLLYLESDDKDSYSDSLKDGLYWLDWFTTKLESNLS